MYVLPCVMLSGKSWFQNDVPFSKASDAISQNAKIVNSSKTSTKKGRFKNVVCPKSPKKKAHVFRDSYSSTPPKKRNVKKDSAEKIHKHRMKREIIPLYFVHFLSFMVSCKTGQLLFKYYSLCSI